MVGVWPACTTTNCAVCKMLFAVRHSHSHCTMCGSCIGSSCLTALAEGAELCVPCLKSPLVFRALAWLHNTGSIVYFGNHETLKLYVALSPQVLIDAMRRIISGGFWCCRGWKQLSVRWYFATRFVAQCLGVDSRNGHNCGMYIVHNDAAVRFVHSNGFRGSRFCQIDCGAACANARAVHVTGGRAAWGDGRSVNRPMCAHSAVWCTGTARWGARTCRGIGCHRVRHLMHVRCPAASDGARWNSIAVQPFLVKWMV